MGISAAREDDRYLELVRAFPLRPIRSEADHQQAKRMLRRLSADNDPAAADYKAVLIPLIAEYETKAGHRLDTSKITAAAVVRHLLKERHLSVNALAKSIDTSQSALSDMLNGKRDWSKTVIVKLCDYFGLQPMMFLR